MFSLRPDDAYASYRHASVLIYFRPAKIVHMTCFGPLQNMLPSSFICASLLCIKSVSLVEMICFNFKNGRFARTFMFASLVLVITQDTLAHMACLAMLLYSLFNLFPKKENCASLYQGICFHSK